MQTTAGTFKDTLRQGHWLPVSASAACLRCVGRVNRREHSTSFYRFVVGHGEELRPSCIRNALCKATVVNHSVDVQVFNEDSSISVNNLSGFLMGEVLTLEPNAFVNPADDLTTFEPFRSTLRFFGKFALDFCKPLLFLLKKAGIVHYVSIGEGSEGVKANINTDRVVPYRQNFRLNGSGKSDIPFARRRTKDSGGLWYSTERTMLNNLNVADLGNEESAVFNGTARRDLGESYAVVSSLSFKTRIAGFFSFFGSSKKRLESKINSDRHVLKRLAMNFVERCSFFLEVWKAPCLVVVGDTLLLGFPRILSSRQEMIV